MLLRESGEHYGENYSLDGVTGDGDGGVPHGRQLIDFAEAVVGGAEAELERTRKALIAAIGEEGFVDAAGVVASFNAVVRIADATGIPVEPFKLEKTVEERAALGIDDWH
ncbi:MAG: hypothetical protein OXI64_11825 [Defluviicoccus sp.]|nr:hypothetical protein [Defluviicoccus sp.]